MTEFQFSAFDPDASSSITKDFSAVDLHTILQEFQFFLKGAGFDFAGTIELVPEAGEPLLFDDGYIGDVSDLNYDDFNIVVGDDTDG